MEKPGIEPATIGLQGIALIHYTTAASRSRQAPCKILDRVGKAHTRDVFYVRRKVDLMKTAKINAYIMHIFGKIELLSIHAT